MRCRAFKLKICWAVLVCVSLFGCALSTRWSDNFALAIYGTNVPVHQLNDGNFETIAAIVPKNAERIFTPIFSETRPVQEDCDSRYKR